MFLNRSTVDQTQSAVKLCFILLFEARRVQEKIGKTKETLILQQRLASVTAAQGIVGLLHGLELNRPTLLNHLLTLEEHKTDFPPALVATVTHKLVLLLFNDILGSLGTDKFDPKPTLEKLTKAICIWMEPDEPLEELMNPDSPSFAAVRFQITQSMKQASADDIGFLDDIAKMTETTAEQPTTNPVDAALEVTWQ